MDAVCGVGEWCLNTSYQNHRSAPTHTHTHVAFSLLGVCMHAPRIQLSKAAQIVCTACGVLFSRKRSEEGNEKKRQVKITDKFHRSDRNSNSNSNSGASTHRERRQKRNEKATHALPRYMLHLANSSVPTANDPYSLQPSLLAHTEALGSTNSKGALSPGGRETSL